MASNLGSAVTPTGHQAYEGLLNQEQTNRAMGQQSMAQQQQMGMAQQQMQQEQDLAQQRMAQQQQQFDVGVNEAQIDRQHQLARDAAGNQFAMQQDETQRKWADARYQKDQNFQLELQRIDLLADQARAKGQQDVLAKMIGLRQDTIKRKSANAAEISLVQSLRGKTKRQADEILNGYSQHIEQMMSSAQRDQELSKNFAPHLRGGILNDSAESSREAFNGLYGTMERFNVPIVSALMTPGLATEKAMSDAGQLRGLEFMKLRPDVGGNLMGAFNWYKTGTGYMVEADSKVDAATMSTMMQDRLVRSALKTLKSMPLKNFDEKTAEQALRVAMSTGDKSQVASLVTKAGVSPTTMRHLLSSISREFDSNNGEGAIKDWTQRSAAESERSGGQMSLIRAALDAEKDSYEVVASLARNASNAFETGMDIDSLAPGLDMIKRVIQNSSVGELAMAAPTLRKAGIGQNQIDQLGNYLGEYSNLEERLANATRGNENLAMEDALLPLLIQGGMGEAGLGGLSAQIGGIEGLMGRIGE